MILAALLSSALATAPTMAPADALIAQVTQLLLEGKALPPDLNRDLRALEPPDRLRVLIFLRRSGMFKGPDWSADDLLAPASQPPVSAP
ncbi:MAG: hypothetical protein QM682_10940 [Paracoccus sp. (in: a-proteobacteria)]|uniref:hypothetical protein n=1 Tax=Paracoccus sp. TaxID=267 RepID=UPI0039E3CD38